MSGQRYKYQVRGTNIRPLWLGQFFGQDMLVKLLVVLQPSINFNHTIASNHIVIDSQLNFCLFVHKINRCITEKKGHTYLVTKTSYFDTSAS